MARNFDVLSDDYIDDQQLTWLELHILGASYLEEGLSCFTEVLIEDDNEIEADAEKQAVSNFEKENKIKKNLRKEQRDARIAKRLC